MMIVQWCLKGVAWSQGFGDTATQPNRPVSGTDQESAVKR